MNELILMKGAKMNYKDIIPVSTIIPNLEAVTKHDVLTALVDILKEKKKITNRDEVLNEVFRREALSSTGLENGLATPHALIKSIDNIVTAIARIPKGVDFIAQDKKPTYFAVLICYPPSQQLGYLTLISGISSIFTDEKKIAQLFKQKTSKDIHSTLIKFLEQEDKILKPVGIAETSPQEIPEPPKKPENISLIFLLIKLQFYEHEVKYAKRGKKTIQEKIRNIRALIPKQILDFYDKISTTKFPPVVPIEGNICKGCNTAVPNEFLNQLTQNKEKINYCPNCRRIVYLTS